MRRFPILVLLFVFGCDGMISGDDPPPFEPGPDGGPHFDGAIPPAECGIAGEMLVYFEASCASNGACHQSGGQFPDLTRSGLPLLAGLESEAMPGEILLVPGDPEASWLYRKMANLQGAEGGGVMPAGMRTDWDTLPPNVLAVAEWIRQDAPATCDTLEPNATPVDPNTLDRDALFVCADPSAQRSSPGRYRRIEKLEFTHGVSRRQDALNTGVINNPLETPVRHEYATYAEGVTLDAATIGVFMLSLPEASTLWGRARTLFTLPEIGCFFADDEPSDSCIDVFVNALLTRGVLFREPSDYERSHLRELTVSQLAAEAAGERTRTAEFLYQASALTSGSLFRSELPSDVTAPSMMDADSLALALGRLLSTHPTGSIKINSYNGVTGDPDYGRLEEGWMAAIREAASIPEGEAGSIFDPEIRRELVLRYGGGVDPDRGFWERDESNLLAAGGTVGPGRMGEFWLTSEFVRFFRQWLDYEGADTILKDDPASTSRYEDVTLIERGFNGLQNGTYREGRLTHQLDDWIARVVVETHESGEDFWHTLMTGRRWHVPATGLNDPCETSADCTAEHASCTRLGDCRNTSGTVRHGNAAGPLVFSVEDVVMGTQAARWVEVPARERLGVLTHPTWLAAHGGNFEYDPSIIERGKWLRERIFCQSVPPLEFVEVEAQLIPPSDEHSARDRVAMSTENERCISCHAQMNSLGYPFELFNHAGFFRETDHGRAPDGSTSIDNLPIAAGEDLNGDYATPFEFVTALAGSTGARRGFIRHAFRYFMGRDETMADSCTLAEMESALNARGSFIDMVAALAASGTFAWRDVAGADDETGGEE